MNTQEFLSYRRFPTSWMLSDWSRLLLLIALGPEIPDSIANNDTMRQLGYMQCDGAFREGIADLKQVIREQMDRYK
jgi:hypothetical protein